MSTEPPPRQLKEVAEQFVEGVRVLAEVLRRVLEPFVRVIQDPAFE